MRAGAPVLGSSWPIAAAGLGGSAGVGALMAIGPRLGIGAMLLLCFVPIVLLDLCAAIAVWVPVIFLERMPELRFVPTMTSLVLLLAWLGAVAGVPRLVGDFARRQPVLVASFAGLLGWVTASVAWADDVDAVLDGVWQWWIAGAIFLVLATSIRRGRDLRIIATAFVAAAVASVLASILLGPPPPFEQAALPGEDRFGGALGDPNLLALGLVPAIALAVGLYPGTSSSGGRAGLVLAVVVLVAGLAASGSRGGLIAAGVSVAAGLVLTPGKRIRLGALLAAGIVCGGAFLATTSPSTWERVRSFDTGGTGRVDLWTVAWRMSEEHPILGVGLNNFRSESSRYVLQPGSIEDVGLIVERPRAVHNIYLQQLAETGAIGLALLVSVLGAVLYATLRAANWLERVGERATAALARSVLVAQLGGLSASIFLSDGYDKRLWILFALGPAVLGIASDRARRAP